MTTGRIRTWYLWHKWTSILCTAFLLLLCITGLPLVFHDEIDELTGAHPPVAEMPADTPLASLDTVVKNALAARPGEVMTFMSWDEHEPIVYATTAPRVDTQDEFFVMGFDARTGEWIDIGN